MYTCGDVCKIFGLHRECLRAWLIHKYVPYSVEPDGRGKKGYFSGNSLVMIGLFIRLLETHTRAAASRLAFYPGLFMFDRLSLHTYVVMTYSNMSEVMNKKDSLLVMPVVHDRELNELLKGFMDRGMYKYNEVRIYCLEPISEQIRVFHDKRNSTLKART